MAAIAKSPATTNVLNNSPIFHVNKAGNMNDNQLQQSMEKLIKAMAAFEDELEANIGEGEGQGNATTTISTNTNTYTTVKCSIM